MTPEEYLKERAAEDDLDLREALKSVRVSRFLRRVAFRSCGVLRGVHTGASPSRDFIDGQQSIGRWLIDEIFRVDPVTAIEWFKEYAAERVEQQTDAVRVQPEGDGS